MAPRARQHAQRELQACERTLATATITAKEPLNLNHFIVDLLPGNTQVAVAAGFSGHGFKFASVIGEILADLAITGETEHNIDLLKIDRF